MRLILLFAYLAIVYTGTDATIRTWSAGAAGYWNTGANWSGSAVPGSGDTARFNGTSVQRCSIDVAVNVNRIEITSAYTGATAVIYQKATFAVTVGAGGYDQTAGTFTGGNKKIDVDGSFFLRAGTFISTTDTLEVGLPNVTANDTIFKVVTSAATFTHNSGTLTFNAHGTGGGNPTKYINVNTKLNLNNVVYFNNSGNSSKVKYFLTSTDTLVINGNVYLNGVTASGIELDSGTNELKGNLISGPGVTGSTGGSSPPNRVNSTALMITGSGNQIYADSNNVLGRGPYGGYVTINKPSTTKVTVPVGTCMRLSAGPSSPGGQKLTVTSGVLEIAGHLLQLRDSLIVNGGTIVLRDTSGLNPGAVYIGSTGAIVMKAHGGAFFVPKSTVQNDGFFYINGFGGSPGNSDSIKIHGSGVQRLWWGSGSTYLIDARVVDVRDSTGSIIVRSCRDSLNNTGVIFTPIDTVRFSIGTNTGNIYNTGTVTSNRSTTVSFAGGASLPTNIGEGDMLIFDVNASTAMGADTCYIRSRDNATQVTLQLPPVYSYSGEDYAIKRAFNTLQAWDDASQNNLTSTGILGQNVVWKGIAYNDGEFTAGVSIADVTCCAQTSDSTDATHFKWLTVASGQRHNGTPGTGVTINFSGDPTGPVRVADRYSIVEWLEIKNSVGWGSDNASINCYTTCVTVRNNLVYNTAAYNRLGDGIAFAAGNGAKQDRVFNNIVFGKRHGIRNIYSTGTDIGHLFYNNTVYNCDTGISVVNSSTIPDTVTNNIALGNTVNFQFYSGAPIANYNAGESGNMPSIGANNVTTTPYATFQDTTKGGPNLHIKTGSPCKEAGTSVSGSFTNDIDNDTRPNGTWDIGADEWYSAGALLSLGPHAQGQVGNALTSLGTTAGARLFRFKLDNHEASRTITSFVFSLTAFTGVVNGDFSNVKIYQDDNGNGLVDAGEATTVGGAGTVSTGGGTVTFSTSFNVTAVTHYILVADLANLWYADGFTLALTTANITIAGTTKDGTCAGVTHNNVTINARSIGTTSSSLFTGTTNTSTNGTKDTLTTSGSYPTNIGEGDSIRFTGSGQTGFILARVSATKIALITALASGETNQTINIYRRYNTLAAWESDRQGNLVTRNSVEKGVCYNDGDLTAGVTVDGSTTDSSHYVWLTVASGQRHNGTTTQGVTVTDDIDLLDAYTIVEWLDISTDNDNDINDNYVTIRNCLIHGTGSGIGINIPYIYYYHYCKLYNNIVYQKSDGIRNLGGSGSNYHNLIFNNIVYKCTNGIKDTGNWMFWDTLKNNISVGNTTNWLLDGSQIADYNAGELGNMPNTGTHNTSTTAYESFVDTTTASRNLHLRRNSVCIDAGTSISARFTNDIDDTIARPLGSAWDLGADERLFSTDTSQWYVDYRNGTDASGKGRTLATPAKNIEWMYDQLPDIFADSVYVINLLPGKHQAADQIQLDANGPYFSPRSPLIIRSYYPDLDSIAMVGATTGNNGEGTFTPTVPHITFDRIMIRGSAAGTTGKSGIAYYSGSSPNNITVKNCVFLFDSIGGVDSYRLAQGIYLETSDSLKVYNNIFIGRVDANDWSRGDGVVSTGKGCRIMNNTFYKVSYAWIMDDNAGAVGSIFANNIFDSLYFAVYNNAATTYNFKFINNAFYNYTLPVSYVYTAGSAYDVTTFKNKYPVTRPVPSYDYALKDFGKLAKGSVLIDSAYDTSGTQATDFYGLDSLNKRDIGACEYNNKKDLFYADTINLFVDYDKADNTGTGLTIASAKKNIDSAYALIPTGTVDTTYVINLLPSASPYQGPSAGRSLKIDGSVRTFPSWNKCLVVQSYYTSKDSMAVLGQSGTNSGQIYLMRTVRYAHFKRLRFVPTGAATGGSAIAFEKFSNGEVIRNIKISECVFDTAGTRHMDQYLGAAGTAFLDSVDIYNCYFGGHSGSGARALEAIYTDSSATYGVRLVNNTFHRLEAVFFNCDNAGKQHFKLLNNIVSYSGVVVGSGGDTWSANTYANWNCYFNATSIAPSPVTQGTDTIVRDPKIQSFTWSNSGFGKLGDDSPAIAYSKDSLEFVNGKINYVTPRFDLFAVKRTPKFDLGCLQFDATAIAGKRIFQQGLQGGGYGTTDDAQIYGFDATYKTYNYGASTSLYVRGGSPFKDLIRFPNFTGKASSLQVPSNAHVDSAFLYLYFTQGASGDAEIYRITRAWTEGTKTGSAASGDGSVTWNAAKDGTANWGTAACDSLNDREPVSVSTNAAIGTNSWERWDVTTLAQDWVSGVTNYGMLLSDQNSDLNQNAQFWASEYTTDSTLRPKLVVYYDEDTATVIHQEGTVTNTVSEDTYLNETSGSTGFNYGAATTLSLLSTASNRKHPLVGFSKLRGYSGSNQIPTNALVTSADLTLFRANAAADLDANESYAYRVQQIWEEGVQNGATGSGSWNNRYGSLAWGTGGALSDINNTQSASGNTTGATIGQGIVWKAEVPAQSWAAGGTKNNGVLIKTTGTISNSIDFYSNEGTNKVSAFYNPKFKATFYGRGGAEGNTPWHTPTRPLLKIYTALTGPITTVSFNQGGTGGATDDAYVNVNANTINWGATDSLKVKVLGDANCRKTLISFTDFVGGTGGRVPSGVIIDTAYIQLVEENSTLGADIVVDIYRVNESWTEGAGTGTTVSAVTSKYRVHTATPWSNDSILAPTSATLIYQNVTLTRVAGNGGVNDTVYIPAKYLVQAWVNGTANNGLMIVKKTSSDGTAVNSFFSSEEGVATACPKLIVKYYKPEQINVQNIGRYATENSNFASADSLKNQFFLSFETRTDSTDGLFNQFKTAATSPGQRIKGAYDLLPTGLRRYSPFNVVRNSGTGDSAFYGENVTAGSITFSVVESTTTRMRYRIDGRTIVDGGTNPRNAVVATEITIYPTGQVFVWDSSYTAISAGSYNYGVIFAERSGTGTVTTTAASGYGGVYSTAAGNQTLHDFAAGYLTYKAAALGTPYTTAASIGGQAGFYIKGAESNFNGTAAAYRQNFLFDFSTDDANHSDTLKRLIEDKQSPASMAGFRTGSKKTNASGDLNADGFNEKEGCYELTADNGEAYFWFNSTSPRPRYYPVFKLNSYTYNAAPSAVYLITPDESIIDTLEASKGEVNISLNDAGDYVVFQLNRHIDAGCIVYVGPRNTLAVEMGAFWGSADSGLCRLGWQTESEKNNVGFNLLRRNHAGGRKTEAQEKGFAVIKSYAWDDRMRGQLTKALRTEYGVEDCGVKLGETYEYALEAVDLDGTVKRVGGTVILTVDQTFPFDLGQNYPNPFNPSTTIRYQVPGRFSGKEQPLVHLRVFNIRGQLIRDLVSSRQRPARYAVNWNGKANNGRYAASGVYFYRLEVGEGYRKVRKMIVVK